MNSRSSSQSSGDNAGRSGPVHSASSGSLLLALMFLAVSAYFPVAMRPQVIAPILHLLWSAPVLLFLSTLMRNPAERETLFGRGTLSTLSLELTSLWSIFVAQLSTSPSVIGTAGVAWYTARIAVAVWWIWLRVRLQTARASPAVVMATSVAAVLLTFAALPTPAATFCRAAAFMCFFGAIALTTKRGVATDELAKALGAASNSADRRLPVALAVVAFATVPIAVGLSFRAWAKPPENVWKRPPRVVVLSASPNDSRVGLLIEANQYWDTQFRRLGMSFRIGTVTMGGAPLSQTQLRELENKNVRAATRQRLSRVPADMVVILSDASITSFVYGDKVAGKTVVMITAMGGVTAQPNVMRNVIAHEMGHALGLGHNRDAATLMCGRPVPCGIRRYRSEAVYYFPLSLGDDAKLRRWYRTPAAR